MSQTVFYHGCSNEPGHYLHTPAGKTYDAHRQADFPVSANSLDGGFLPPNQPQTEGRATLAHINGWTLLAFWDRSVDTRLGSNSAFLIRGTLDFAYMVARCKDHFPNVWARYNFEVIDGKEVR